MTEKKQIGDQGERIALGYLKKIGYKIIETNFRKPFGEIDIIAKDKNTLVFVEVKTRTTEKFGSPQEGITSWKKRRIIRAVQSYLLKENFKNIPFRIDVLAIKKDLNQNIIIKHFKNAIFK